MGQCVDRIIELRPFERALGLASRAFIAALPLAIVTTSLTPAAREGGLAQGLIDRFGLTGDGRRRRARNSSPRLPRCAAASR